MAAALAAPAVLLGACGRAATPSGSASSSAACRAAPAASVAEATTASYRLDLVIGPAEEMMSHPTGTAHPMGGEVMLSGQMAMLPGMSTASGDTATMSVPVEDRHLEVHVCSKTTGQVVANLQPSVSIVDESAGGATQQLPVAVMQDAVQGASDLHYGNNVVMAPGHAYDVQVVIGSERASFKVTMPTTTPPAPGTSPSVGATTGMPGEMSHP